MRWAGAAYQPLVPPYNRQTCQIHCLKSFTALTAESLDSSETRLMTGNQSFGLVQSSPFDCPTFDPNGLGDCRFSANYSVGQAFSLPCDEESRVFLN